MTDAIIEIFMKFIVIYCISCFGGSLLWKTKTDWKIRRFTMSLPSEKKVLQRVKKKATLNCNDDLLAFAIGIRNGFLMVMPFWLVVLYLVIWKLHNYERVKEMIASNGIVDIHSKKQAQEFTMEMTKEMLHETIGFVWGRTT